MVGRSAAFRSLGAAQNKAAYWSHSCIWGYTIVILKVILTKDLMSGTYGPFKVVAGRRMKIIKEMERES